MRDNDQDIEGAARGKSRSASHESIARSKKSHSSYSKSRSRSRSRSRSNSRDDDGYRLHIADISEDIKRSDLEKLFSQYGSLKEVWMTNSSPCFGFAVFKDKKAANTALNETDGV